MSAKGALRDCDPWPSKRKNEPRACNVRGSQSMVRFTIRAAGGVTACRASPEIEGL